MKNLPDGCTCAVDGTLGRVIASSLFGFSMASCDPSFNLRLLIRLLERFSVLLLDAVFVSSVGASAGDVIALNGSFGELGVLDEECLR